EIGGEPEKWDPKTRETADHSLPYIFARTLVDGTINAASFEEAAYRDPSLRPLMAKIRVRKDEEVDALYPETVAMKVEATTTDGRRYSFEPRNPLGHNKNPMQDKDIRAKFLGVVEPVLGSARASKALERWWELRHVADISEALNLLDIEAGARGKSGGSKNRKA
ncbi:MAG: MmgE/PrpD family protein, partial [Candidatus Binatia bacterium]